MQKGTKANKADSTLLLTYWLRVHIAKGQCIYHMVLHFLYLFIKLSLLSYPLT